MTVIMLAELIGSAFLFTKSPLEEVSMKKDLLLFPDAAQRLGIFWHTLPDGQGFPSTSTTTCVQECRNCLRNKIY
jgi:hypothetical protein